MINIYIMFTKDSIVLAELICSSEEGICFIDTYTDETIPINNCEVEETEDSLWINGIDKLNSNHVRINAANIKVFTSVPNPEHTVVKKAKDDYTKVTEICSTDNIPINMDLFYKDVPVYQKVISMYLNKPYGDITFDELNALWKKYIEKHCLTFEEYIIAELEQATVDLYKEELLSLQSQLQILRQHEEMYGLRTKEDLTKYWPSILMPAPSFVNI